nr:glycosyltransferase [Mucilaginibacter sp. L294]
MNISVIIPTYNPTIAVINEVLNSLKHQTFNQNNWELIIINNNSTNDVVNRLDISWHKNGYIIDESESGLTFARLCGFKHAKGDIIIMVDDDNILASNYLDKVDEHFKTHKTSGAVGGKINALFQGYQPPHWTRQFWPMLAIRDLGNQQLTSATHLLNGYPQIAPVGAGMAIRKALLQAYIQLRDIADDLIVDRKGDELSSGGDNEIVINILQQGYSVTYYPALILQHIIPTSRLTKKYLSSLNRASSKSWIRLLSKYNICTLNSISAWTVPFRKVKAWFAYRAWGSPVNYIKWKGACGSYESLAKINNHNHQ